MERIAMNQEERDWLEWLKRVQDGVVTQRQAGVKMGVTAAQSRSDGVGGATPALRIEHTTGGPSGHSKPELSTLLESGTFYFALTRRSLSVA